MPLNLLVSQQLQIDKVGGLRGKPKSGKEKPGGLLCFPTLVVVDDEFVGRSGVEKGRDKAHLAAAASLTLPPLLLLRTTE